MLKLAKSLNFSKKITFTPDFFERFWAYLNVRRNETFMWTFHCIQRSFTKTFRYVSEHSVKWIVHMKVCFRSFTFKNIHVNERSWIELNVNGRSRERLCPVTFGNVRRRLKKEDLRERYSTLLLRFYFLYTKNIYTVFYSKFLFGCDLFVYSNKSKKKTSYCF